MPPIHIDCTDRQLSAAIEPVREHPSPAAPTSSPDSMASWWDSAFNAWCVNQATKTEQPTTPTTS